MEVKPIGEAVFEMSGQTYRISASELKQQAMEQNSSLSYKGGTEDWSVSFSAVHAVGEFTWLVPFSLGVAGASLGIDELVKQPTGVEIISGMRFEFVEDEE